MLPVRVEKRGIRALGIAESFRVGLLKRSCLAGVVMRADLVVDGFVFGSATIGGDDATDAVIGMFYRLERNDINVIILRGVIISFFNIIDLEKVYFDTNVPVIGLTFEESEGLDEHIKHHFPQNWQHKIQQYHKVGERKKLKLKTGSTLFIRAVGLDEKQATQILNRFTLQGAIPEPVRVAHLLAHTKYQWDMEYFRLDSQ
ncbi:MAG: DUF99 family protein [Nitrososphaerales archaeon]